MTRVVHYCEDCESLDTYACRLGNTHLVTAWLGDALERRLSTRHLSMDRQVQEQNRRLDEYERRQGRG